MNAEQEIEVRLTLEGIANNADSMHRTFTNRMGMDKAALNDVDLQARLMISALQELKDLVYQIKLAHKEKVS